MMGSVLAQDRGLGFSALQRGSFSRRALSFLCRVSPLTPLGLASSAWF